MDNSQPKPDDGGYWRKQPNNSSDFAARTQARQPDFTPKVQNNVQPQHKFPRPQVQTPGTNQTSATSTPNAKFDFIMKQEQQKPPTGVAGWLPGVSRNMKIAGAAIGGLLLLLIITSVFSGGTTQTDRIVDIMARDEELLRVTQLVQDRFQDPATANIAATTQETVNSNLAQMKLYIVTNKLKYKQKALTAHINKQTDASFINAEHNNNLDAVYLGYLQSSLNTYQQTLSSVYKTSGPNLKKILQATYNSIKVVLTSTQFNKASNNS